MRFCDILAESNAPNVTTFIWPGVSTAYVLAWVLGGILTLFIWREIEVTTALAIILSLVATFMMSKIQGDAALLLMDE